MRLLGCDVACIRGGRKVFSGISFAIGSGQALLITGPNGAGKTSLLRLVAGLLDTAAGRISLEGGDPELSIGEQAHYVGHQDALKLSLSVYENIAFWTCFLRGSPENIAAALATVGLGGLANLPAGYLSAGQRRRLSIARLLTVARPIWLLDEPSSVLDSSAQAMLSDLMRAHRASGGLVLAAAHGAMGLDAPKLLSLGITAPCSRSDPSECSAPAPGLMPGAFPDD
jgi:heme exporter protein A